MGTGTMNRMTKRLFLAAALFTFSVLPALTVQARTYYWNYVQRGGVQSISNLTGAPLKVMGSYPSATVRVDQCGTSTLATIYSSSSGTAKPNPFTASSNAFYDFWHDLTCFKLTFSGGGLASPITIDNIAFGAAGWAVQAPAPSGSDDLLTLQSYLDLVRTGIDVILQKGVYLTSAELTITGSGTDGKAGRLIGVPQKYDASPAGAGTEIRLTATARSTLAITTIYNLQIDGIKFNANRFGTYAVYLNGMSWSTVKNCSFQNAIFDGLHLGPDPNLNGVNLFQYCFFVSNGTTYATSGAIASYPNGTSTQVTGTVATTASNTTLTFTGAPDLTTLGIRAGELIRIHSSPVQLVQIASVTASTITAMTSATNRPSITGSGFDFAIGVGAGYFEEKASNNNVNTFLQSVARGGPVGFRFDGLYGPLVLGGQADFNNFVGVSSSRADNASAHYGSKFSRLYTELNVAGQYFVGEASGYSIDGPNDDAVPLFAGDVNVADVAVTTGGETYSSKYGPTHSFVIQVTKTGGGVLQHRFLSDLQAASGSPIAPRITSPSTTYVNTPTVDSVTPFVGGAGLSSDVLILDSGAQSAIVDAFAVIESNSTGEAVTPSTSVTTINVNGTTRVRFAVRLYNASGTQVGWGATIGTSESLAIRIRGRIR